jgi:N-acetylneuraminic acid mutarotase
MRLITLNFLLALLSFSSCAQQISWEELAPMPEAVSNNAVTEATVDGVPHVFSFAGIDTTKDWFGIHLRSFRYNVSTNNWETIDPLPDPNGGKIAAGASTVKNKIYIIGGYHVASNYSETSSAKVHIYDPETNTYLPDGAPIPVAIDDQVQAVWRDSLIYVITGWSNTGNVADVQIYNPETDVWAAGTSLPNNSNWKVFGGSGTIIGDTIYYAGGAKSIGNFPATTFFRKGYIDPDNPTQITWEGDINIAALGYRMAASHYEGKALWFGGSDITYNFNGIAYNGSGGVHPNERISYYDPATGVLSPLLEYFIPVMDLRGVAKVSPNQYIIAGGMKENQIVTDRTLRVTINNLNKLEPVALPKIKISPNPADQLINLDKNGTFDIQISDLQGNIVYEAKESGNEINIRILPNGAYILSVMEQGKISAVGKFVVGR